MAMATGCGSIEFLDLARPSAARGMSMFTVVGGIGAAKLRSGCTSLEGSHGLNAVMWPPMSHRSHRSAHSSTLSSDGRMKPTVAMVMVPCRLVAIVPGCERG